MHNLLAMPLGAMTRGGDSSCHGYLAAALQAGGCGDVYYGYDAEVELQSHLGVLGHHKKRDLGLKVEFKPATCLWSALAPFTFKMGKDALLHSLESPDSLTLIPLTIQYD